MKLFYFLLLFICLTFYHCTVNKNLHKKSSSIKGQWKLVSWYNDVPVDLNNDGNASKNLYKQWNDCKKHLTLVLEDKPSYYYNTLFVYNGTDSLSDCLNLKRNDIKILPNSSYSPTKRTLDFVHKYYVDKYKINTLNDSILEIEGSYLLGYFNDSLPKHKGGIIKFKRVLVEKELNIKPLLEAQDLMPYPRIFGTVTAVTKTKKGHLIKVKTYWNTYYHAIINKDNLNQKSIFKIFKKGDKVILKGETYTKDDQKTMLVKTIYATTKN